MKRIQQTDLVVDGMRFLCHDITDVVSLGKEPEMVEVTIQCTMTKKDYEKLMEDIANEIR